MKDDVGKDKFSDIYVLGPYRVLLLCTFPSGCRRTLLLFDILRMSEISFYKTASANKIISKTTTQKLVELKNIVPSNFIFPCLPAWFNCNRQSDRFSVQLQVTTESVGIFYSSPISSFQISGFDSMNSFIISLHS